MNIKNKSTFVLILSLVCFAIIALTFSNFIIANESTDGDDEFGVDIISIDGFKHHFYFLNGYLVEYEVTPVTITHVNGKHVINDFNFSGSNDNELDENLREGLISYYKLDDTFGEVVDSTGLNYGTNFGAVRGVEGKMGNAFEFNGQGNYVNTNFGNGLIYPNGISLQVWIKSTDSDDSGLIISRGGGDGATAEFLGINAGTTPEGGGIPCTNVYGVTKKAVCADKTINDNEWHHVVGTYDSSEISIYLDGVKFSEPSIGIAKTTDNFKIGWDDHSSSQTIRFFKGTIDEVAIWERALSSEEVLQLYNEGNGLSY